VGFERIDSLLTMEEKAVEKVSPPSENDAVVLKTLTVAVSDVKVCHTNGLLFFLIKAVCA